MSTTPTVDSLIAEHAAKLQLIYAQRTAGDHTFVGALAAFLHAALPVVHAARDEQHTDLVALLRADAANLRDAADTWRRSYDQTREDLAVQRAEHAAEVGKLREQSAARDNETAELRAAVAEIAELRANWVDDYVKRALKRWRESSWTSAEADRIEQAAIQKWNARHPALIALWRRHEQARAASPRGGQ